jgi:hypothetical protein
VADSPVIIIGAPRSGTNMLRDLITAFDGFATWPCDEIPGIWMHGNLDHPDDELTPVHATDQVQAFIRERFARLRRRTGSTPVEKTCASSLRVPFVDAVFPDARYVFIVRHGLDATASAMRRWTGSTSLGYLARKARWTPATDLPRFVWRTVRTRFAPGDVLRTWGPRFDGMDGMAQTEPLHIVCAEQWRRCVESAADDLDEIPRERVLRVRYEDVAADPATAVADIAAFLGVATPDLGDVAAYTSISAASVGKGAAELDAARRDDVLARIRPTLRRFGYEDLP